MAKKKAAKKKTSKKTTKKTAARSASGSSAGTKKPVKKQAAKKSSKKKVTKKKATKKVAKKVTKKKVVKKKASKKSASKKTAKKTSKKSTTKKTTKKSTSKSAAKKTTKKPDGKTIKKSSKKTTKKSTKKTTKKASATPKETPASAVKSDAQSSGSSTQSKSGPKGNNKRRRSSKSKKPELVMPVRPLLLGPNGPSLKPLIPSGKDNQREESVLDNVTSRRKKTPLTKTQLEKYRLILLEKRAELLGEMRSLEDEALRGDSGRNSHTSQHLDDAGSESYEQSLNLNLAAADRDRIVEIDAALERIENRTYGLCEMTFEPIKKARLDEIPWTRYTIDAARELDRRGGRP
ncbi:MAG: TraR/DksA family transcriptional regulator [Phycisphaerales bacterium JB052]